MPRRVRVLVEGAIDHVYYRTTRREPVFVDHLVEERFPDVVRDVKQRDRFAILTRCLMPNHHHLFAAVDRSTDQISRWAGQASRRKAHDGQFRLRLAALDVAITSESPRRE